MKPDGKETGLVIEMLLLLCTLLTYVASSEAEIPRFAEDQGSAHGSRSEITLKWLVDLDSDGSEIDDQVIPFGLVWLGSSSVLYSRVCLVARCPQPPPLYPPPIGYRGFGGRQQPRLTYPRPKNKYDPLEKCIAVYGTLVTDSLMNWGAAAPHLSAYLGTRRFTAGFPFFPVIPSALSRGRS